MFWMFQTGVEAAAVPPLPPRPGLPRPAQLPPPPQTEVKPAGRVHTRHEGHDGADLAKLGSFRETFTERPLFTGEIASFITLI